MAAAVGRFWRPVSSSALVGLPPVRSFATSFGSPNYTSESRSKEEMKPIDVHGMHKMIRTSPWKLNLVARQIRGLSIDKALIQMMFSPKKASAFVKEVLVDTHERAQRTFNIAKGNMHVAESYVGTGPIQKSIRYHAKGRFGIEKNRYAHYFLILREGPPPPKKKRLKEDCKHYKTLKIINAGPRRIPNSL